ncbi:MAG: L-seryl-tRNA(Sec) selenium transferase [Deltaproteobacteria bacterium]|jgi:L-seryl-tRNA(Ser) seleniumtransferase|nr:L-seryl-tRNA(Sec) selenium transferase [Deltaproteobacteria bacterium]
MSTPSDVLKSIPKVEKVIGWALKDPELKDKAHSRLLKSVRLALSDLRTELLDKRREQAPDDEEVLNLVKRKALDLCQAQLRPVINATGIVLHTNLGRAPLAYEALERVRMTAQAYSNLEYDVVTGCRSDRQRPVKDLLIDLTGAEAAMAVNNNAAALFLLMVALAKGRRAVVSRGELVEIGGSFRLSDIIEAAGVSLIEVGSTNQTRLSDYQKAASAEGVALILKVHASNFRLTGYSGQTEIGDLAELCRYHGLPLVVDLGSGSLVDLAPMGLKETPIKWALSQGADAVCFSGDKLLGGPQAGLIAGSRPIVEKLNAHPLARTVRPDKMTLAALEATLLLIQDPEGAKAKIPIWRMLNMTPEELKAMAIKLKKALGPFAGLRLSVVQTESQAGGGAAPEQALPSYAVAIESLVNNVSLLEERLRRQDPPVVARIQRDQLLLDARTIAQEEFAPLKRSLTQAWGDLVGLPVTVPKESR